ncbi:MAG: CHAP domain-containing protein [bacterium]
MRYKVQTNNNNKITNLITKLQVALCLVLFLYPTGFTFALTRSQINDQTNQAQDQKNQAQQDQVTLGNELDVFDGQISQIQLQIGLTQAEIDKKNTEIVNINNQIAQTELDLLKQRNLMNEYLKTIYIEGQTSTIEMIATSNSFSDFVNQSEYLSAMQQNVQDTANKILSLKMDLEENKKDLILNKAKTEQLKVEQVSKQQSIEALRSAKASTISQKSAQVSTLNDQIRLLRGLKADDDPVPVYSGGSSSGNSGNSNGYPWAGVGFPSYVSDNWGFYLRQCTSYAAWMSASRGPVDGATLRHWGTGHPGNANGGQWADRAIEDGFKVSSTPTANSIMVFPAWRVGDVGHVAYVDSANGDTVHITEYNWDLLGNPNERTISASYWAGMFITK